MDHENSQKTSALISKKEILTAYQISYGTLYRWKRQGLIPEEWFIRRSTSTGQETFFPKDLIEERIRTIMERGENSTLRDIASRIRRGNDGKKLKITFRAVTFTSGIQQEFLLDSIRDIEIQQQDGQYVSILDKIRPSQEKGE